MSRINVNPKISDIIEKLQRSLMEGRLSIEDFPKDIVKSLLEDTLGKSFWSIISDSRDSGFAEEMPEAYMNLFEHFVAEKDIPGCVGLLGVFERHYKGLYGIIGKYENIQVYQDLIRGVGYAWAQVQYRLHEKRQEHWSGYAEPLPRKRGVVYTCMFEAGVWVEAPLHRNAFWDYFCFTNREDLWGKKEKGWQFLKPFCIEDQDDDWMTNYHMINAHTIFADYDFSIWVAPEMRIVGDLNEWYEIYGKNASFLSFSDYKDDSIYDILITTMVDDDSNIGCRKKRYRYLQEGYPEHYGLIDTRCLFRNHRDEILCEVLKDWWEDAVCDKMYGKFGFNYAAWKKNFKFAICNQFVDENRYISNTQLDLDKKTDFWLPKNDHDGKEA